MAFPIAGDAILCRPTDLADYLQYDYVGALWPDGYDCFDQAHWAFVGNGGRDSMSSCIFGKPMSWRSASCCAVQSHCDVLMHAVCSGCWQPIIQ